jgi:excinuclease ABC subunit A
VSASELRVRGAREHNLQNLELSLPRERLVVVTGPSGSGKSSLAFDTIYAEAQRRFVESLGVHARRALPRLPKPEVDLIEGLSPAIAVRPRAAGYGPRSSVGTVTEVDDLLRLLFARIGEQRCPHCGAVVANLTVPQMVDRILSRPAGTRFSLRAPIARDALGDLAVEIERLKREGFVRAMVDGMAVELAALRPLAAGKPHSLEVDVDRLAVRPEARGRLSDSLELGLREGKGLVRVVYEGGEELSLTDRNACASCGLVLSELTPASLSANTKQGACEACVGLGERTSFDPARVVPDAAISLRAGAIAAWGKADGRYYQSMLGGLIAAMKLDADKPFGKLSASARQRILHGAGPGGYEGVLPGLARRLHELLRRRDDEDGYEWLEAELSPFSMRERCAVCGGTGLSQRALCVRVKGKNLADLASQELGALEQELRAMRWQDAEAVIAEPVLREVLARLRTLIDLGLGYLSLDRRSRSLSRGEAERIGLAAHLSTGLSGVLYVLDEPTTGLHPRDTERLLRTLLALRDRGNSVLVVEHDLDMIAAADHVVDLGPGAGARGGRVMASGTPREVAATAGAPTGPYLEPGRGATSTTLPRSPSPVSIRITDARAHNLAAISVDIPLGRLTCVTGVSGSGKSSLVMHTLLPAAQARLRGEAATVAAKFEGLSAIERVIHVGQSPIGRTPRSSPATYAGLLGPLRELFAALPEARARGFGPQRFSFNLEGGRCEQCEGAGVIRVDMQMLPDVYVRCDVCEGARYERETLQVRYRGRSIADVLQSTVDEASELFGQVPRLAELLASLRAVGLGYLRLGQSALTLSAGEAQRLRLGRELARRDPVPTLYLLDEPTAGLHPSEVDLLADVLDGLLDKGHTVVVVEHNLELIKRADHLIDLGPEAGAGGGRVVAVGTPAEVASCAQSHTGRYLAARLAAR